MSFLAERDMARRALEYQGPGPAPPFPPVAGRIRVARERLGVSVEDFAAHWSTQPSDYWDLELIDGAIFTTVSLRELPRLATELGLPLMVLLFGEAPMRELAQVTYRDVAEAIEKRMSHDGLTIDELSRAVGRELQPILDDPEVVGAMNLKGVLDVCQAVRLDWVGLVDAVVMGLAC